jgi:hypothetical protein
MAPGPQPGRLRPRAAFVDTIAKDLHKTPAQVRATLKAVREQMLERRLSEAVAAGRLTRAQADQIKHRIESGTFPPRLGRHWRGGFGPPPGGAPEGPPPGPDGGGG